MQLSLELSVPPRPEYVSLVRLVVASFAGARRSLIEDRLDDVKLAVSEACTNAFEAQAKMGNNDLVTVRVYEGDDRMEIHIIDHGTGFDPEELKAHPPVTDPDRLNFERGLGIPLIRNLVDDVSFEPVPGGGTRVRAVIFGAADDADDTVQILRTVFVDGE